MEATHTGAGEDLNLDTVAVKTLLSNKVVQTELYCTFSAKSSLTPLFDSFAPLSCESRYASIYTVIQVGVQGLETQVCLLPRLQLCIVFKIMKEKKMKAVISLRCVLWWTTNRFILHLKF